MTASLALLEGLTRAVSGSPLTYLVVLLITAGDAVLPVLPSETVVIAAATLAEQGRGLSLWLVVPAAALGAFAGDTVSFLLGARLGSRAARRLFRGEQGAQRLDWARERIRRHGILLIILARFVPGGRTATTFSAGTVGMPWRRFVLADATAATLWAAYTSGLGFLGGSVFRDQTWLALAVALGLGLAIALLIEAGRRLWQRAHAAGRRAST